MLQSYKKTFLTTRTMTTTAMLGVISVILSFTPLGYLPISIPPLTIMHIPVIIGSVIEGPLVGMTVGLIFGLTSLIRNLMFPSPVSFVFLNPMVSVVPRVLIGFTSYYAFRAVLKITKKSSVSYVVSAIVGSLTNSIGVLSMVYVFYAQRYLESLGKSISFSKYLVGLFTANSLPEAIFAGFLVLCICKALNKFLKRLN